MWSFVNNLLQLRAEGTANSFGAGECEHHLGLGGLLDVASELGIERSCQDFGLTLGAGAWTPVRMWCCPAGALHAARCRHCRWI